MKKIAFLLSFLLSNMLFFRYSIAQNCNDSYYPFKQNTKFTLQNFDAKQKLTSSNSYVITEVSNHSNGVKATVEIDMMDAKGRSFNKTKEEIICEGNTIRFDMRNFSGANLPPNQSMEVNVEGDNLELPSNLSAGQSLKDAKFRLKASMNGLNLMNKEFIIKDRKVEAEESVTTPAGTFKCFKISQINVVEGLFGKKMELKSITWYAKGVGMVKSENYDQKGKISSTTVLSKFEN